MALRRVSCTAKLWNLRDAIDKKRSFFFGFDGDHQRGVLFVVLRVLHHPIDINPQADVDEHDARYN